jgi:hypothetical protein
MAVVLNKTTEMIHSISSTLSFHLTLNGSQSIKTDTMELGLIKASPETLKDPVKSSQGSIQGPDFSLFETETNISDTINKTLPSRLIQKVNFFQNKNKILIYIFKYLFYRQLY